METNLTHSVEPISKEEFIQLIREHDEQQERLDKLTEAGLPLWDSKIIEYGNLMFENLIEAKFTSEGADWIFWWLYELPHFNSETSHALDENGNPIPTDTLDDLWDIIKNYRTFC